MIYYLIFFNLSSVGSCVENFVVFELWQSFQAEYHNGQQNHKNRDDCHDSSVLAGLGVLEQQPDAPLKIVGRQGLLLLFNKAFVLPENRNKLEIEVTALTNCQGNQL